MSILKLQIHCQYWLDPMVVAGLYVTKTFSRWWFQIYIFYFYPYLGKLSILTNIFRMGWNHQLVLTITVEETDSFGTKQNLFPVETKKGCFSMRPLHYNGDALGLAETPSIPGADLTMRLVICECSQRSQRFEFAITRGSWTSHYRNPPFDDPDLQFRYRAYWRFHNRQE